MTTRTLAGVMLTVIMLPASSVAQERERIRIDRAEDLPRHTYTVTTTATALLEDDAQFTALATQLEADLLSDLATYIIEDRATLKRYYGILSDLAVVRGNYDAAVAWQDSIRGVEEKPALRLFAGIVERSLAAAARVPEDRFQDAFREGFRREVSALPYAEVRMELAMIRQGAEFLAAPNALAMGRQVLEQQVEDGRLSLTGAQQLVRMRMSTERIVPLAGSITAVLDAEIAANDVEIADIWSAREASLEGRDGLAPLVIAIWDSGVDVDLFPGRLFVNPGEVSGNGRDDDGNGYVDDVHGIAHDLNHDRSTGVLGRITLSAAEVAEYGRHHKGQADLYASIDSPEAQGFRQKLASMSPNELRPWLDGLNHYADHIHGTHVAGIAVRGNPAVRVLVARNEEDAWKRIPQLVTLEGEKKRAREYRETVEYFKRHGVRVVNMSWAFDPDYYADILEKNQAGGDADGRRRLAREMFDTAAAALRSAIESAPDILFVAAAMNQDADNRFQQLIPASFDLPNLITVGAVDRAGNEAAFTSYGKVDLHANGVDVPSFVPGGEVVPISGTSMAAPQVVNLAAKLLALKPALTVAELRRSIIETADETSIDPDRRIRLLNPRAAVERVIGDGTVRQQAGPDR